MGAPKNLGGSCFALQGVPKRSRLGFCLISQQPSIVFSNHFFFWKLRSLRKFWIQNHFWAILGGQGIYKTKWGSETEKFIFILSQSGLKTGEPVMSWDGTYRWYNTGTLNIIHSKLDKTVCYAPWYLNRYLVAKHSLSLVRLLRVSWGC